MKILYTYVCTGSHYGDSWTYFTYMHATKFLFGHTYEVRHITHSLSDGWGEERGKGKGGKGI